MVFLYTGNVGSSALVTASRKIAGVFAPFHEDLDGWKIDERSIRGREEFVIDCLSGIQSGKLAPSTMEVIGLSPEVGRQEYQLGVLKWRPFKGNWARATRVFKGLHPVLLLRKSIVQQAMKIVSNLEVFGSRNPQFAIARMEDAEYEEFRRWVALNPIQPSESFWQQVERVSLELVRRTERLIKVSEDLPFSNRPQTLWTESLLTPEIQFEKLREFLEQTVNADLVFTPDEKRPIDTRLSRRVGLILPDWSSVAKTSLIIHLEEIESSYRLLVESLRP